MSSYLEKGGFLHHCLDGLNPLPIETSRSFALMTDLDKRSKVLADEIDGKEKEYAERCASMTTLERKEKLRHISQLFRDLKALGEEKVQLSNQIYETVDKHIRKLDTEIHEFEAELKEKLGTSSLVQQKPPAPAQPPDDKKATDKKTKKKGAGAASPVEKPKKDSKPVAGVKRGPGRPPASAKKEGTPPPEKTRLLSPPTESPLSALRSLATDPLDMPVDPNEPTYCVCNQVSFGEMVGCDNPECLLEWFHFSCMNLKAKPKGKWWCPQCAPKFDPNYKKSSEEEKHL